MFCGAVVALAVASCAATAADLSVPKAFPKQVAAPVNPREFTFTPYLWTIFVSGDLRLGDNTAKVDTNIFKILDEVDNFYAWMSYQELRNGPFSLYANVVWSKIASPIRGPAFSRSVHSTSPASVWSRAQRFGSTLRSSSPASHSKLPNGHPGRARPARSCRPVRSISSAAHAIGTSSRKSI